MLLLAGGCASGAGIEPSLPAPTTAAEPTTTTTPSTTTTATVPETTTSTPPPTTSTTGVSAATPCERLRGPVRAGEVSDPSLPEISGVAASRTHPGVLWVVNDSGNAPTIHALALDGTLVASIPVDGENIDWEDLALGPGPGGDHLYVADIGDNRFRRESVTILRLREPDPLDPPGIAVPDRLEVTYPDGPADAEAVVVEPDGDVLVISKVVLGEGTVYRVPASAWAEGAVRATAVGTVDVGLLGLVTAADASVDGTLVAVRTYTDVFLFSGSDPVDALVSGDRCAAPTPSERQGEAITVLGEGFVTVGEGVGEPVWRVDR